MPEPKTLEELRGELHALTRHRAARITAANEEIENANREFDRQAVALNREIEKLAPIVVCPACGYRYGHRMNCPADKPETKLVPRSSRRRPRTVKTAGTAGWSAEDLAHYTALQMQQV